MTSDSYTTYDFDEFTRPEWPLMSQVSRPSRYCFSEWRPSEKKSWDNSTLKICLAFPDVYEVGMSYYGFQIIEPLIHSLSAKYLADRVYCPWPDMAALMLSQNVPLSSVTHKKPVRDFDILAFTMPHETSYTNILSMMKLSGINIFADERENSPIVIAGGYGAYNPAVMSEFVDVFCVGEAEALLPEMLRVFDGMKGQKRAEILREVSKVAGCYVPSIGGNVVRQYTNDPFTLHSMIVPSVGIIHDRAAVELFRGCSRGCRFCQAGMVNRPVRERPQDEVSTSITDILSSTGYEEAGLLSLASCDYSCINGLIEELSPKLSVTHTKLSLPSLRMDSFSVGLAEKLSGIRSNHGSITFAPEAGTQRLRDVINKGINEEMMRDCLTEIFSRGWEKVKLYFMMGLPTETEDDLDAIADISQKTLKLARSLGRKRATVSVSVSGFVPKPHTPFQWERQNDVDELREKGRRIKSQVRDRAISLSYHEPEQTYLEGLLSRGDEKLCPVIFRAWEKGACFDSWTEYFNLQRWLEAFDECGVDPGGYTRERNECESLAWDFVNVGVSKEFLLRERHNAYGGKLTVDCKSGCAFCGIGCQK